VLGSAMGIGIGGAAINAAVSLGLPIQSGVAIAFALAVLAGATGLSVSGRLPGGRAGVRAAAAEADAAPA